MNNIIVCKKWNWLWVALLSVVLFAGIGFILQMFQPVDAFEKALAFTFGLLMTVGSGYGILVILFGDEKAEEICNWIYGISMALACIGFLSSLVIGGIISLVKVIL